MSEVGSSWSELGSEVKCSREWPGSQATHELLCLSDEQQQL